MVVVRKFPQVPWSTTVVNKIYRGFTRYLQPMAGYEFYIRRRPLLYTFFFVTRWSPFSSVAVEPISSVGCFIVEVYSLHSVRHTTLGRTPLNEWSASRRGRYFHNTQQTQTWMASPWFEPAIPIIERPKTYALDRTATRIGNRPPAGLWLTSQLTDNVLSFVMLTAIMSYASETIHRAANCALNVENLIWDSFCNFSNQ